MIARGLFCALFAGTARKVFQNFSKITELIEICGYDVHELVQNQRWSSLEKLLIQSIAPYVAYLEG